MIELKQLSASEVGAWVEYRDRFDSKPDRGSDQELEREVYFCGVPVWGELG